MSTFFYSLFLICFSLSCGSAKEINKKNPETAVLSVYNFKAVIQQVDRSWVSPPYLEVSRIIFFFSGNFLSMDVIFFNPGQTINPNKQYATLICMVLHNNLYGHHINLYGAPY
jgi:hypothetical protein